MFPNAVSLSLTFSDNSPNSPESLFNVSFNEENAFSSTSLSRFAT
nr:MAG TPA: hypothetical protein [Caudoviricetes sp.]